MSPEAGTGPEGARAPKRARAPQPAGSRARSVWSPAPPRVKGWPRHCCWTPRAPSSTPATSWTNAPSELRHAGDVAYRRLDVTNRDDWATLAD